ncbi:MAG: GNAT family N-acetyltransferase [Blastocatellia bacterium]|nr:GNAT family N-acetyltransferase [Blastocatellia bacterium]MDQ3220373.1 GNAT family N-acetyltransferase [Acidobacteriota bacterium]
MNIRLAVREDIDALVDFNLAMALETEAKLLETSILRNGVEAVFNDESKGFYVVAEETGVIIGGLMITFEWSDWRSKWFWWIQSVYIVPESRRKGIYKLLYDFVRLKAKESRDVCGFRLYVEMENLKAQKVYERVGMTGSKYLMYEEKL